MLWASKAERLFKNHFRLLIKISLSITNDVYLAEDAVSETFVKTIKRIKLIDDSNKKRVGALLIIMCKQSLADLAEQRIRAVGISVPDPQVGSTDFNEVENEVLRLNSRDEIQKALHWLPTKYLEPFLMFYLDEIAVIEISKNLKISPGVTYSRIRIAKEMLREEYYRNGGKLF